MDAGILPVKHLRRAKARLSEHFSDDQRAEIAAALLDDALALCESVDFMEWWVVSDDDHALKLAGQRNFRTIRDSGVGLNEALGAAIAVARDAGASSVTVIPCDVPLAFSGDVQDLLDTGATSDAVVVPSRDGGTNGLHLSPPNVMAPRFGPHSFKAHIHEAERLGIRCSILSLERLELDIDTIEDVDAYLARPKHAPSRTGEVLERLRKAPV